jgi:3-hydroxybutyryl-CoA dehydrogenase
LPRCSLRPASPSGSWTSPSRCSIGTQTTIQKSLAKFVERKLAAADRDAALQRLSFTTALDQLADADYIVEAIVEDADAKRTLFARLDQMTRPETILASNTSSISITTIGAATKRPTRCSGCIS